MTRQAQKIITALYNKEKIKVVLSTENIIENPLMYTGGFVKGVWFKKIKKQLVVQYQLHGDKKHTYVILDIEKDRVNWIDFLTNEKNVSDYFDEKLVL